MKKILLVLVLILIIIQFIQPKKNDTGDTTNAIIKVLLYRTLYKKYGKRLVMIVILIKLNILGKEFNPLAGG